MKEDPEPQKHSRFSELYQQNYTEIRDLDTSLLEYYEKLTMAKNTKEINNLKKICTEISIQKLNKANEIKSKIMNAIKEINKEILQKILQTENSEIPKIKIKKKIIKIKKKKLENRLRVNRNNPEVFSKCICGEEFEDNLVICKKELCKIKVFHFNCVKEKAKGKKQFICQNCEAKDNKINKV